MRRLSLRDKVFQCRAQASDIQVEGVKITSGVIVFVAPSLSLALLAVENAQFLTPLLGLAALITCASLAMTFVVVCDLLGQRARSFPVWQREALGRLLRNFMMGLMVVISLLSVHLSLDGSLHLKTSALTAFLPCFATVTLSLLKVLAVHTEHSCYWGGFFSLVLMQGLLVVFKVDYSLEVSWAVTIGPIYVLCLSSCVLFAMEEETLWRLGLKTGACLLCGASACLGAAASDMKETGSQELYWSSLGLAAGSLLCLAFSTCDVCGSYILDIFWGHVEIDLNYHQSPVQLKRMHTF